MEDEEPEDILCTKCGVSTYQGETIFCETCELWFHWACTGVKAGDAVVKDESLPYYCPDCIDSSSGGGRPKGRKKGGSSSKNAAAKSKAKTTGKSKPTPVAVTKPSFKLKLKLTGKNVDLLGNSTSIEQTSTTKQRSTNSSSAGKKKEVLKVSPKARESCDLESLDVEAEDERDEEERWLDAVEAGDVSALADRDPELRTLMDPKLMTSRQRAMVEKSKRGRNGDDAEPSEIIDDGHISLDYFSKPKKKKAEESEHDLRVKALKIQQRKEVETQKREENKQRTMERLLNKKESKAVKVSRAVTVQQKPEESRKWTYVNNAEGARLHLPPEEDYPLTRQEYRPPPTPVLCIVSGCGQLKRYSCSKTGQPLCSMECYKKQLLHPVGSFA